MFPIVLSRFPVLGLTKLIVRFTARDFTFYDSSQGICNTSTFVFRVQILYSIAELDDYVIVSTFKANQEMSFLL